MGAMAALPASGQAVPVVVTGVTVIDGTGAPPRVNRTVVVHEGRIVAVGDGAGATSPEATIVDGRGKFLIPGLWDMHAHLTKSASYAPALYVANGVTGVRDMGGDWEIIRALRDEIDAGVRLGPRIKSAGPMLESPARVKRMRAKHPGEAVERTRVAVADSASGAKVVDSLAREGVDFIKLRTVASPQAYRGIAAAARSAGLRLAGHSVLSPLEMIRAGQRSIEHPILRPLHWRPGHERRAIIRALARERVAVVPTLVNFHQFFMMPPTRARAILADSAGRIDPRRPYVGDVMLRDWREQVDEDIDVRLSRLRRSILSQVYASVIRDLRAMHRAGVRLLPGSDLTVAFMYPGFSLHDELRNLVTDVGMTPMQALRSATQWSAEHMGMQDSLGTIEPGKLADLVLLDADPLRDIANTTRIVGVFRRGEYLDREAIDRLLEEVRAGLQAPHALPSPVNPRQTPWRPPSHPAREEET